MVFLARVFLRWLPLAIGISLLCGLLYTTVQQNYRQALNDPQVQMAEDAAAQLSAGAKPSQVITNPDSIDITNSLAPWLAVYTADGVGILSSGAANGGIPVLPAGIFKPSTWHTYAEDSLPLTLMQHEDRVTWQSSAGVRQALVIVKYASGTDSGFVVAGRSTREVETREGVLVEMVVLGWLVAIIVTFAAQAVSEYLLP